MKAIVCNEYGAPSSLTLEDVPSPVVASGHVGVMVKAAGVNFPDLLVIQDRYQNRLTPPFTPGCEVAGVVTTVGDGVSDYSIGDRVCARVPHGAFAEQIAVKVDYRLASIPDGVDFETAAAFPLAYGTSCHALKDRARLQSGETLLVLGASGGVGMAVVQLGKLMGARVIACASSPEKLATCRQHGADDVINYETENLRDAVNHLTGGKGVDVICDPVGGKHAEPALRSMAWKGRYCVIGFTAGDIPQIPINLVLLKGCSIVGVSGGSNARNDPTEYITNQAQMLTWMSAGKLRPVVTARYPLARTAEALELMLKRGMHGKAVILI